MTLIEPYTRIQGQGIFETEYMASSVTETRSTDFSASEHVAHQNLPKQAIFNAILKKFSGEGAQPLPQTPPPVERGRPPPHAPPPSAPAALRSSRLRRSTSAPSAPRGPQMKFLDPPLHTAG